MTRLSTMAPQLVPLVNEATPEKLQAVKLAACLYVLPLLTEVEPSLLKVVEDLLTVGTTGTPELLEKLESLAWSFDEKYLPLKERTEYLKYFIQARGLTALQLALTDNSADSACDCIYEIGHASDDQKPKFLKFIQSLLD